MLGWRKIPSGAWMIDKHEASILDYGLLLTDWLKPTDTLPLDPAPVWTVSDGFTKGEETYLDGVAYVALGGGPPVGTMGWAECTWNTTQGRREVQRVFFNMVQNDQ